MKGRSRRSAGLWAWALVVAAACLGSVRPAAAQNGQFTLTPRPDVDERLFLVRALEVMYGSLPAAGTDSAATAQSLMELRGQASRMLQHIQSRNLDPRLAAMYQDFVRLIDGYQQFLEALGAIARGDLDQVKVDGFKTAGRAAQVGMLSGRAAREYGASKGDSAAAGLLFAGATALIDAWATSARIDRERKIAAEGVKKHLTQLWLSTVARAQQSAQALEEAHGWRRGEAGFDLSAEFGQRVLNL